MRHHGFSSFFQFPLLCSTILCNFSFSNFPLFALLFLPTLRILQHIMELPLSISQIAHTSKPTKEQLIPHEANTRTPSESNKKHQFNPPPSFWDNLSKHELTASTLREFDRRTTPRVHLPPSNAHFPDEISLPLFKRFCPHGGPSLAGIAGVSRITIDQLIYISSNGLQYPGPPATPIPKSHSEEPDEIMAYTGPWEQHLNDFGIHYGGHLPSHSPTNLSDIQARLKRRRPSLDNSDDDYPEFLEKNYEANSKSSAMSLMISTFLGNLDIPHEQGILFSNLTGLTDGSIPMPKPVFYDGSHPSSIEYGLREDLAKFIMPSNNPSAAILPTFLMSVSGSEVATIYHRRAAWYYGVFAARGIHRLRCRIPLQKLNNKRAYVLTAFYDPGSLCLSLYATHVVITNDTAAQIKYHTAVCMKIFIQDGEEFRAAIRALRNAREWARDQREELIHLSKGMTMRSFVIIP